MTAARRAIFLAGAAVCVYAAVAGVPVAAITGDWRPTLIAAGLCAVPFCRCVSGALATDRT